MCYSAQIWADYRRYKRAYGSEIDIATFAELFWSRLENPKIIIPKAVEASFDHPTNPDEQRIKDLINQHRAAQAADIEEDLFKQKTRLAGAERKLAVKLTKAATESKRIATHKIARGHNRLKDLNRFELQPRDSRIFPGHYAPVMVMEHGRKVVRLMRYQCRPAGKPAFYDEKYPGTYNARKDSLTGFWRGQFGYTHGLIMVDVFYENVDRPGGNVVLEFHPVPARPMLVACLWSKWTAPGQPDCCRSQQSPTTHRPKWLRLGTTAALCPSSRRTSIAGFNLTPSDSMNRWQFLKTQYVRTMSTALLRRR